jgi:hypothetical protein
MKIRMNVLLCSEKWSCMKIKYLMAFKLGMFPAILNCTICFSISLMVNCLSQLGVLFRLGNKWMMHGSDVRASFKNGDPTNIVVDYISVCLFFRYTKLVFI